MNKTLIGITIVLSIFIIVGLFVGIFILLPRIFIGPAPVACTLEAKLCPDGSYVARIPPSCEFAPCPAEPTWKTYSEEGIEFQYPEKLTAKYVDAEEWPPKVTIEQGEFSCVETPLESSLPEFSVQRTIDDRVYCVIAENEGAAGSTYANYTYTTSRQEKLISLNFVLRFPHCLNYNEPQKSECQAERETFDMDGVIDRIVLTMEIE